MTRDEYLYLRRTGFSTEEQIQYLYSFYMDAEHEFPKVDYPTFLEKIVDYINMGRPLESFFRSKDAEFNLMFIKGNYRGKFNLNQEIKEISLIV